VLLGIRVLCLVPMQGIGKTHTELTGYISHVLSGCGAAQVERCVSLLSEAGRLPEAAMLARAYKPSIMSGPIKVRRAPCFSVVTWESGILLFGTHECVTKPNCWEPEAPPHQ
jgi:hypothetical protein